MIDLFVSWKMKERLPTSFPPILDSCVQYNPCYYEYILSDPLQYLPVHCSIKRDRCEIPLRIYPPMYNFPNANITYVYNELIRYYIHHKKRYATLSDFPWYFFLKELRYIILFPSTNLPIQDIDDISDSEFSDFSFE